MRVLLLGGTGFIGAAAATHLRDRGHHVIVAGRGATADEAIDATDHTQLESLLRATPAEAVVNLLGAGLTAGTADTETMTRINADVPAQLAQVLAAGGHPVHLVHASSSTERMPGETLDESEYARTKRLGTQYLRDEVRASGLPTTILRIHNTYGPGQPDRRFVANVIRALRARTAITLNFPERVRDFVFIDDVSACLSRAVETPALGVVDVEVGTGIGTRLADLALLVAAELGAPALLVQSAPGQDPDPHPTTVAAQAGGTYGLCTTTLAGGIRRTIQEA